MPLTIGGYGHDRDSGDGCGWGVATLTQAPVAAQALSAAGAPSVQRARPPFRFRGLTPVEAGPGFTGVRRWVWDELAPGAPVDHSWPLCPRNSVLSLAGAV